VEHLVIGLEGNTRAMETSYCATETHWYKNMEEYQMDTEAFFYQLVNADWSGFLNVHHLMDYIASYLGEPIDRTVILAGLGAAFARTDNTEQARQNLLIWFTMATEEQLHQQTRITYALAQRQVATSIQQVATLAIATLEKVTEKLSMIYLPSPPRSPQHQRKRTREENNGEPDEGAGRREEVHEDMENARKRRRLVCTPPFSSSAYPSSPLSFAEFPFAKPLPRTLQSSNTS
jgi:hypothetical protein